jgi:hypothetical protein
MRRVLALAILPLALLPTAPAQDKKPAKKDPSLKVLYSIPLVPKPGEKQKLTFAARTWTR